MNDTVKCPVCGLYNWDNLNKCQCGFNFTDYIPGEPVWFFVQANRKMGPIPQNRLIKMMSSGVLDQNALVWSEGLSQWTEATKIEVFQVKPETGILKPPPLPVKQAPPPIPTGNEIHTTQEEVPQVRPWVRYWARMIDYVIFSICLDLVLLLIAPSLSINVILRSILIIFLWLFLESFLLSTWGTTPGKKLLIISLLDSVGFKLDFEKALARSVKVWVYGMGLGIPIVQLVANYIAFDNLKKKGLTDWDKDGGYQITHGYIGRVRIFFAVVIIFGFILLASMGK